MQHSVSGRALGLAAAFACLLLAGCGSTVDYKPEGGSGLFASMAAPGARLDETTAISVISDYRRANGLPPVARDPELTRMALEQARVMAARDKLGHSVDGTLEERARRVGYAYARIAENIGGGHDNIAEAFGGWRDSSGHRHNMLMPGATRMGIAIAQAPNSRFKVYWAMVIAEPAQPRTAAAGAHRWGPAPPDSVTGLFRP